MKIQEIEGYETLATKTDVKELSLQIRELRVEFKTDIVALKEQLQRIKLLIWLPVITGALQLLVSIWHK